MIISPIVVQKSTEYSLEDWIENPPEKKEWIDGKLLEKNGILLSIV